MCVIIVKPAGVALPNISVLRAAAKANPHGFGFVSKTRYFRTLDIKRFLKEVQAIDEDEPMILHFRLATHGSIRRANCHPFKHSDVFMAHNGIIDIEPDNDKTDSQTAFDRKIYPAIIKYGLDSPRTSRVINELIGSYSKIAIMQNGNIRLFGDFQRREYDGCYYSNLRFEHLIPRIEKFSLNHL